MAEFCVMDHSGDTRITLDTPERIAAADKRFQELRRSGYMAVERLPDGTSRLARKFTSENTIVMSPQLIGG